VSHPRPRGRLVGLLAAAALSTFAAAAPAAQTAAADSVRIERLAALGRLWVSIKYFHPWPAYRPIDWDAALVAAVPRVSAARDRAAYAAAIADMLGALGDPVTRVLPEHSFASPPASAGEPDPRAWWTADSILVVSLRNATDLGDYNRTTERLATIADTIRLARRVIFDLRAAGPGASDLGEMLAGSGICSLFAPTALRAPDQRGRLHSGYPPDDGTTSGGYYSGFYTIDGATIAPGDSTAAGRRAAILVNEHSAVPDGLLALRQAGRARIVAEGSASEAGVVRTYDWRLPDSVEVAVRLTELLQGGTPAASLADTTVPVSAAGDAGLAAALASLAHPPGSGRTEAPTWAGAGAPAEDRDSAAAAPYPALPYRLMAGFRIWAVGQFFFPYRDLTHENWDRVLTDALPRLEAASDPVAYGLAVAEMATHLHDSHVGISSRALRDHFGTGLPPVFVRMIEGVPVITHFTDDSAARAAGARVGDVIVAVDGEDALARLRRLEHYISASTPQALHRNAAIRLVRGAVGSTVRLRVRRAGQAERTLTLTRMDLPWNDTGRSGPMFRILPGNIGYADLGRLPADQVDSMFERLKATRAIIFDMRGYPKGTAWTIAPRLTDADMPVAARFSRPAATTPDTTERTDFSFTQALPHTDKWRYRHPTVMLIDERTQSQAEHTGLFLEAANGTKFIGSPTAGANGDVTVVTLPGGVRMSFSGHAVRHADGRQLQRIGLVPDLAVRPTIAGVRAGRDEVLEAARRYLERSLEVPPAR
jgi:C-terminal processing protease CtpA/Prc